MDIEQMRIRMGEMGAEIERLQGVIDEANSQEPIYQYSNTQNVNLWTDCDKDTYDIMRKEYRRIVYARPIPAQQSPAVAVPETETVYFRYANSRVESTICVQKGEAHKHVDPKLIIKIVPHAQSPRITEQDASEIINSAINFMYETKSRHSIDYWLHEEGRALLNKLNGVKS